MLLPFFRLCATFALASRIPYCTDCDAPGPTFLKAVQVDYPGHFSSLRAVDFRNFVFPKLDVNGNQPGRLSLKDGHVRSDTTYDHFEEDLVEMYRLPVAAGRQSTLVLCWWTETAVSSSQGEEAYLFVLKNGHLQCVQVIRWDLHFGDKNIETKFDNGNNALVIRSAHYLPGDAHCCVSATDVVTFRWTGKRLVPDDLRTELTSYGRRVKESKAPK